MSNRRQLGALLLLAAAFGVAAPVFASTAWPAMRVVGLIGSSIEIVDGSEHIRTGLDLAGTEFTFGGDDGSDGAVRLRIVSVEADRVAGVFLHELEAMDAFGGWHNVCDADREHRRLALFIEGHDLPDGRQVHVPGEVSITCTAGVQGKCIRAGYVPWERQHEADGGGALFQTCTRLYRADYCGDGIGWTRNGMVIDVYDIHGIQQPEVPARLPLEAGWGPGGATCVHHTRVIERGGIGELLARCPRLAEVPSGAACTSAAAAAGALMFNRSSDDSLGLPSL